MCSAWVRRIISGKILVCNFRIFERIRRKYEKTKKDNLKICAASLLLICRQQRGIKPEANLRNGIQGECPSCLGTKQCDTFPSQLLEEDLRPHII
ncbi:hypothetical protein AV530_002535 [Patagioenas fasciata monilis]|uniref:Uncharacterized protein n=1 Tax=Patagioenas fasciata monilis TaxID=372326 RepID=A0A1V4K6Q6_PATFA|nr:hypothetical protein AV530_002535 [Patagioenas fasciata monilis]